MTKRIFCSIFFVAFGVFLASLALIMGILYGYFTKVQQAQLKMQTILAAQGVSNEGAGYFQGLDIQHYRITWIGADGAVLYDSQSVTGENHLAREEVVQAFASGYGESLRDSATLMLRSLYAAQRLADGTVLRLSIAQNSILTLALGMAQPICTVFLVAVILSALLAVNISRRIVRPLAELDLDAATLDGGYEELMPLLRRAQAQQKQLKWQEAALQRKQDTLNTIVSSMSEGMVLLDRERKIVSSTPAAAEILGDGGFSVGADILALDGNVCLKDAVKKALGGERAEQPIALRHGRHRLEAAPIISGDKPAGAALLFFDITEKEKTEALRREFTANVSHELKTPLQSISGCAELLENGMVRAEDIRPFAGRIHAEARRMTRLVEDIIHLSQLDEGAVPARQEVDLYEAAQEAASALQRSAAAKQVRLAVTGERALVNGARGLICEMIYNLCDNAIKYNVEGGSVEVLVAGDGQGPSVSVSDTGIGIPPEYRDRIFERFFRVDKSRSKASGGTGLGLSIVKHIAQYHGAEIAVESEPGRGTTISVSFGGQSAPLHTP